MTTAIVTLKAYGDYQRVERNSDGTVSTHVSKRVLLVDLRIGDQLMFVPRSGYQHPSNILMVPVCTPTAYGMDVRLDRWQLYDMVIGRLLPTPIPTLDPGSALISDLVMRYVLEARHLPDEGQDRWMAAVLAEASGVSP